MALAMDSRGLMDRRGVARGPGELNITTLLPTRAGMQRQLQELKHRHNKRTTMTFGVTSRDLSTDVGLSLYSDHTARYLPAVAHFTAEYASHVGGTSISEPA